MARDPKHFRTITLRDGRTTRIDPSEYRSHTNLKAFDEVETKILRVHRHAVLQPNERGKLKDVGTDHYLVYGLRSAREDSDGKSVKIAEAYELVINEDMVPAALAAVAKDCGVEDLLPAS